ncbi:Collagen Alpha-3(Vi) Chain [Manis pentadactyla]|nr:Collagen Alpha-3(Vi) Chain [Manis pentadactyla]
MSGTAQPVFKSEIQKHYLPPGGTDHPGLGNTDGRPGPVPSKKLTDRGEMIHFASCWEEAEHTCPECSRESPCGRCPLQVLFASSEVLLETAPVLLHINQSIYYTGHDGKYIHFAESSNGPVIQSPKQACKRNS